MHRTYPEIDELLRQVADRFGKEVSATTDFERLSDTVESALREQISVSTLKRLWGYVNDRHKPRVSTLDILCRYVGYRSFADFQAGLSSDKSSAFLSERTVRSADLQKGAIVEIGWLPNRYLFLENVDRLLKSPASQRGRDFAIILASLSDLGYTVEWRVINAAEYGMPQRRRRTYIVAYRNDTPLARSIHDPEQWILQQGTIATAFPVSPKANTRINHFSIDGALDEVSANFNAGKTKLEFENTGMMTNRHVTTAATVPNYQGECIFLGQIILPEQEVPEEFFITDTDLPRWQYLKGSKSEVRKSAEGYEYKYSEGGMAFPDGLDKPSRTIITGEGGAGPSRFKHVIQTESGRYRRLTPIELERLNMFPDRHTEGASDMRRAFLMGNALVTGIVEKIGIVLLHQIDTN